MPFMAEQIWQRVTTYNFTDQDKSVHLESWPQAVSLNADNEQMLINMNLTRQIVEVALAARDLAGIKIRQPLAALTVKSSQASNLEKLNASYLDLIKDEINVKEVKFAKGENEIEVELDTTLTPELKAEGTKRELVRFINAARKEANLTIADRAKIYWFATNQELEEVIEAFGGAIKNDTLANEIIKEEARATTQGKQFKVNGEPINIFVEKINS
jgi:isoleucyl-tRNA synthetase